MKPLFFLLLLLSSCKAHIKEKSDPEWAISNDGKKMLVVSLASDPKPSASRPKPSTKPHFCVTLISQPGAPRNVELLTKGGLTDIQLKSALRYMSLPDHLISGTLLLATGVAGIKIADKAGLVPISAQINPVGWGIIGLTVTGAIVYRIIKGRQEGEDTSSTIINSIFSGPLITGPLVEAASRNYRFRQLTSDEKILKLSDKKMQKVIARIKSQEPRYKGTCDGGVLTWKVPNND